MSRVLFIGDLHLGHKNIHKFRKEFSSQEEHEELILENLHKYVRPRDKVFYLGDAAFNNEVTRRLAGVPGRKVLVRGNHDNAQFHEYVQVFEDVQGIMRYKYAWLSHCPIHPQELRGKINIHGHVHSATIPDVRYVNCSAENIGYIPIDYRAIIYYLHQRKQGVNIELRDHIHYPVSEFQDFPKPVGEISGK